MSLKSQQIIFTQCGLGPTASVVFLVVALWTFAPFTCSKKRGIAVWGYGLDLAGSGSGSRSGCCEHGSEPSGSALDGEFPDQLSDC
jgi:hypothetical protein